MRGQPVPPRHRQDHGHLLRFFEYTVPNVLAAGREMLDGEADDLLDRLLRASARLE